ncbi:Gfo/Idh/MocA family oxidoreductase, partial [Escherichia coli]|nr:Gfo/Idh/MocA family oxidoreductase [Escherichia coli]
VLSYSICYAFLPLFSIRFIILFILLSTFLILLPRITWQLIYSRRKKGSGDGEHRRSFLIGAGDGGALFMDSYQHPTSELELVGILDKDSKKKGQKLGGIPVLGYYDNVPELTKRHQIERVLVAIPSLDPSEYERILHMCN